MIAFCRVSNTMRMYEWCCCCDTNQIRLLYIIAELCLGNDPCTEPLAQGQGKLSLPRFYVS